MKKSKKLNIQIDLQIIFFLRTNEDNLFKFEPCIAFKQCNRWLKFRDDKNNIF